MRRREKMNKRGSALSTIRNKLREGDSKRKYQGRSRKRLSKRRRISTNKKEKRNSKRRLLLRLKESNGKKNRN